MKKLFIGALALTMFTACSQDEIVEQQQLSSAITFDGGFVNNATRAADDPSTKDGKNPLAAFDVWAFMNDTDGTVFVGEDVNKGESGWTYTNIQYWLPNNTYYFGALAPMNSANWSVDTNKATKNGIGNLTFTNVNGTEDLLYAAKIVETGNAITTDNPGKVKLEFNHLLSKVKFTFTNGFVNENNYLVVENIKMIAPGKGTINLGADAWWNDETSKKWELDETATTELEFGHMANAAKISAGETTECDFERLTIPASADQNYVVTFDVTLYNGNQVAYTRTLSTTIENAQLRIGYAYNFKATLNHKNIAETELLPIEFNVEAVRGWVDNIEYDGDSGTQLATKVASVATVVDLNAALATGATNFKLTGSINGTLNFGAVDGRSVSAPKNYTLDLNGNDIITEEDAIVIDNGATLTINGNGNVKTSEKGTDSGSAVWVKWGHVIINGGTYHVGKDDDATGRNDCIYVGWSSYASDAANRKSSVTIYNGTFSAEADPKGQSWVLNLNDAFAKQGSTITVYGGTFINFNPAEGNTENPNLNFVAPGYGVEKSDANFNVKALPALSISVAAGKELKLNSNAIITGTADVAGTLDGGEETKYTLFAEKEPTSNNGLIRPTGTATIKNLIIDGENKRAKGDKSLRAFYINVDGTYTIENVITKGTGYALNCGGEKAPTATLKVSNSTFEGWTSYSASVTATFDQVNFIRGNYFENSDQNGYFRPYGTTTLVGCEFALGYIIDFGSLAEGKTVTFKDCKYNGVELTAENIPAIWENYVVKSASVKFE